MHGEYKVPGGKLVVIDLNVVNGQLHNVELSGDFFLEPEEALERMTSVIEGLPADVPTDALTRAIASVVAGAELLGITPEGVAIAVRRAVEGANQ